tara:strand:+ start:2536 stop:3096 length:561 start_codon:yes stop_codon:yes gene_type:complete
MKKKIMINIIQWIASNGGLDRKAFVDYTGADFTPDIKKTHFMTPKGRLIREIKKTTKHKYDKKLRLSGNVWEEPFPIEGGLGLDSLHQKAFADNAISFDVEMDDFYQLVLDCFNGNERPLYSDSIQMDYGQEFDYPFLDVNLDEVWKVRIKMEDGEFCTVGTTNDLEIAKKLLLKYDGFVKKLTRY